MVGREEGERRSVDHVLSGIDRCCIMGGNFMLHFMKDMNFKGDGFGTLALNLHDTLCAIKHSDCISFCEIVISVI